MIYYNTNLVITCCLLLMSLFSISALAEGEQQFAELKQCDLANGLSIRPCRIGYRTLGHLNKSRDNILVFPTWFTGNTGNHIDSGHIGPGKFADTSRYHVITIDALGNGVSSSPSNSAAGKDGSFPVITIGDMVNAQYRLLKDVLDISHVHAVMGISMGGMQTFQWVSQYPDFMDYAVAVDGSPKMTSFDLFQWQAHRDVIQTLQKRDVSNRKIMDLIGSIELLTIWTPDYVVKNIPVEDTDKFIRKEQEYYSQFHPDDYLAQLGAMIKHDIYAVSGKSEEQMVSHIRANMMVVSVASDHMVNPVPALKLADALGAEKLVLENNCGHWGTTCERDRVAMQVNSFLGKYRVKKPVPTASTANYTDSSSH